MRIAMALAFPVVTWACIGCGSSGSSQAPDGGGGGTSPTGTGGASNPNGSCRAGVPARGQPTDTSNPTAVIGTGTAASCTFGALQAAATAGGVITFDCGGGPVTIPVTATLN